MPDVYTFVTAIFADDSGAHFAQLDQQNSGQISEFQSTDTSVGFVPVDFDFSAKVHGAFLYGFEVSGDCVVLGQARPLAKYLENTLESSPRFRHAKPRTAAAIERFLIFTSARAPSTDECYLFELALTAVEGPYVLTHSTLYTPMGAGSALPQSEQQWQAAIIRNASADHSQYFNAHQAAGHRLDLLTQAWKNLEDADPNIGHAVTNVLLESIIANDQLVFHQQALCAPCLFRLASRYPTPSSLDKLITLASAPASTWQRSREFDLTVRTEAMEAVRRSLVLHSAMLHTIPLTPDHLQVLAYLEADGRLSPQCREILAEVRRSKLESESEEVQIWQAENARFPLTINNAILTGEREYSHLLH
jgi:hypothetical protein